MDWQAANAKDLELLNLRSLRPLDASCIAGAEDLVARIEEHNARTARAGARVRELAENRTKLADFNVWQNADSVDIATQRSRVRREAWDVLLELRRVLEEREAILRLMEARLMEARRRAGEAHDRAVAAAEKRLVREHRRLLKSNRNTAGRHFADLVAQEQTVADAAASVNDARAAFEAVAHARRGVVADSGAVKMRQREVFRALVS